jgi:hypothetical protein
MKASNLTISIPDRGCDQECPYCISKITGKVKTNFDLMQRNTRKIRTIAQAAGCTSVLITSKGETLRAMDEAKWFMTQLDEFPTEIQTNGKILFDNFIENEGSLLTMFSVIRNLNVIALSIDTLDKMILFKDMIEKIRSTGILVRICLNLSDRIPVVYTRFKDLLPKLLPADQILVRHLSYPKLKTDPFNPQSARPKQADWIDKHVNFDRYQRMYESMTDMDSSQMIRVLPHGTTVWDVAGISVCFSDWCVQESNRSDDIRSLIFLEDGHLYTSWAAKGSILF